MPINVQLHSIKNENGTPMVIDLTDNQSDDDDDKAVLAPVVAATTFHSDNFLHAILGDKNAGPLQSSAMSTNRCECVLHVYMSKYQKNAS